MNNIKMFRSSCGMTLQQVADAVGSTKPHIWELESGKSNNPTIKLAYKIAAIFDVSVYEIWPDGSEVEVQSKQLRVIKGSKASLSGCITKRLNESLTQDK